MSMIHHPMSRHPSDNYYGCAICTFPKIRHLESRLSQVQGELKGKDARLAFECAERDALKAENERLKTDVEDLIWNLGACSTFAMGYGIHEPWAEDHARPAPKDVLRLALKYDSLKKEVQRLRGVLESCGRLDRSKEYKYGEADRWGNKPGQGQRWKTPREIATEALASNEEESKEILYTVQCKHNIPYGQHCKACNR